MAKQNLKPSSKQSHGRVNDRRLSFIFLALFVLVTVFFVAKFINVFMAEQEAVVQSYEIPFNNAVDFTYDITKVDLDNDGVTLFNYNDNATLIYLNTLKLPSEPQMLGFEQQATVGVDSLIAYQLTTDYNAWYYHNGEKWDLVGDCQNCYNTAVEINENIATLPIKGDALKIKVLLASGIKTRPHLESVSLKIDGKLRIAQFLKISENAFAKKDKGDDDDDSGDDDDGDDGSTCLCEGKMKELVLQYSGNDNVKLNIYGKTKRRDFLFSVDDVDDGEIITLDGRSVDGGTLKANTYIEIVGSSNDVKIHTSCSEDIMDQVYGNFTVLGYTDKENNVCGGDNGDDDGDDDDSGDDDDDGGDDDGGNFCEDFVANFYGWPAGTILNNQFVTDGIHISAVANNGRPNQLIVFDSDASGTPDPDLEVDIGNLAIIPENVTDNNNNNLVDVPNDSAYGGTQIYTFDEDRFVESFVFVDKEGQPGTAVAYDSDNNVVVTKQIPAAGNASVQTIEMNAPGVRRLEISYEESGAVTSIVIRCDDVSPPEPECPFDPQDNRTIINFDGDIIIASGNEAAATEGPISTNIVPGEYEVRLASFDDHENKPNQNQPNERWYLILQDGQGDEIVSSNAISDLPDDQNTISELVNSSLIINQTVEKGVAFHVAYPDSNANSIVPVCAALDVVSGPPSITIKAHKVVCDDETYLPNWGYGTFPEINSSTAQDFVNNNSQHCDFVNGWSFQWGPADAVKQNGDFIGPASPSDNWSMFDTVTAGNIPAKVVIDDLDGLNRIWLREVLQAGYLPFTAPPKGNQEDDVTAEFYCHTDVLNFDNYEYIDDIEAGRDYYCIAFNVLGGNGECGNGIVEGDEECDDGNNIDDDACSNACIALKFPPNAVDDSDTTPMNTPVVIDILNNDSDQDGVIVPSTVSLQSGPDNGNVIFDPITGEATYTPNTGFYGQDSFVYEVCDDDGLCDMATVVITINQLFPPEANDDTDSTEMDTPVDIDILANDSDVDGTLDPTSVTITVPAGNGLTDINPVNGVVTYTPANGFYGIDTFTYEVCDDDNLCDTAVVTVTVLSPPIAEDDSDNTDENVPVDISILFNDYDLDGSIDANSVVIITPPIHGDVTYNPSNQLATYTPDLGYSGLDTFEYKVCDNDSLCDIALVTIGVNANVPPVANDDSDSTDMDTPVDIDVLDNDSDSDGFLVLSSVIIIDQPDNGLATVNLGTGVVTYTPDNGFYGTDVFEYKVCDDDGACDTAYVTVDVNAPPVAVDDTATTPPETLVMVEVLNNDFDVDGILDISSLMITVQPSNGNASVDTVNGKISYTPDPGFTDVDTLEYKICDNDGACDTAIVTITVLSPPIAEDDSDSTEENTPVDISVLDNDSDPDGTLDPSSVTVISGPSNGGTSVDPVTGVVTYTPNQGFNGIDVFTYRVCDNDGLCDTATVTIGVNANTPPVANNDTDITVMGVPVTTDVMDNDSDADGVLDPSSVEITDQPDNGSVNVNPGNGFVTYTPDPGFYGIDTYDYKVCDDDGACDNAVVTITVLSPPIAADDTDSTLVNVPVTIDVLDNDSDPDGTIDESTVEILLDPTHGNLQINPNTGAITYTPDNGYYGSDNFRYKVCDNDGLCDFADVDVEVLAPPVANDDSASTDVDTPVLVDILDNDYDLDGVLDPNTAQVTVQPANGNVTINPITGEATYTPDTGYTGTDVFTYVICDDDGLCDTADVTIGIETLLPPVANNDSATTQESVSVTISVLVNDSDADGVIDPTTTQVTFNPSNGNIVSVDPLSGAMLYDPNDGFTGVDTYEYEVCDNDGLCDTAIVEINVQGSPPPNQPPVALDDVETTEINTPVTLPSLINDRDPDGVVDPGSVQIVVPPSNGGTVVNLFSGDTTYTPNDGYFGVDTYTYLVCDNRNACDFAVDTITIFSPPIANNDSETTSINTPVDISILDNDDDLDGTLDPASVLIVSNPSNGDVTVDLLNGVNTYTPDTDYQGLDRYDYRVCDNDGLCDVASVTVAIDALAPPIANNDFATTDQNVPVDIIILANDSDVDGTIDVGTVLISRLPNNGNVSVDPFTGLATYNPDPFFTGIDTFEYEVCDNDALCDTAVVTVTVISKNPPIALDDVAITAINSPVNIAILANDSDIDGFLIPATAQVTVLPPNGSVGIDATTGVVTYAPNLDFEGLDIFDYKVCDNDGLCDTATVRVTIGTIPPPPPPPTPPPPTPPTPTPTPLIVPPTIIPPPVVGELNITLGISPEYCGGRVYSESNLDFPGFSLAPTGTTATLQYSLSNGLSWRTFTNVSGFAGGVEPFLVPLENLAGGNYTLFVQAIQGNTVVGSSEGCEFNVASPLIFGANQFILDSQLSPISSYGVVQFVVDQPQTFFLEATGATKAEVINLNNDEVYPLTYDPNVKLWQGTLVFDEPGLYRLAGEISNVLQSYSREINTVMVTDNADIIDANSLDAVNGVTIKIFQKDPSSNDFVLWNASAYGKSNPLQVDGQFSLILPKGEFYIEVSHPDYNTATSLITDIPEQSVVTANVKLIPKGGILNSLLSFVGQAPNDNFLLITAAVPDNQLIQLEQLAPNINMVDKDNNPASLYGLLDGVRPAIILVFGAWSPFAQEQVQYFSQAAAQYSDEYQFIPLSTIDPENVTSTYLERGDYGLNFYKPNDQFFDNYAIISLPQFFVIDANGFLQEIIVGSQSPTDLISRVNELLGR